MIPTDVFFVTLTFDIVAVLIILGLFMVPKDDGEKDDPGAKIFMGMGICIVAGAVLDILSCSGIAGECHFITVALPTLTEITVVGFMFLLLLYTDFVFFGSRDHLRRHFTAYLMPFAFIAVVILINMFAGVLYTVGEDQVYTPTGLYYVIGMVEYLYLFIPAGYFFICLYKAGNRKFFHPLSICIPIIFGVVLTIITPFTLQFLGFATGLAFLIFSRIDAWRFIDRETGFYNREYLEYVVKMIVDKKGMFKGMIVADIDGDRKAFSGVLREELPGGSEVVCPDDRRFVYLANTGNMTDLDTLASMIGLGAEEYDEVHPDKILLNEAVCSSFIDDEAIQAALGTFRQRGNAD